MRKRRRPGILVYHPDEVDAYARLINVPRGRDVAIHVAATEADAAAHIGEVEVIYAWKLPPALYGKARRLRWLQAMGAGVEWALAVPDLRRRVVVTRAPGVFGPWMSEYVIGWCAWVTQRMETYRAAQRERRWRDDVLPERLRGRTLTLIGIGDIGGEIARVARAVGLHVVGVSRSGRRVPHVDRVHRVWNLHRALSAADFVVVVAPLTPATRGLIAARPLARPRATPARRRPPPGILAAGCARSAAPSARPQPRGDDYAVYEASLSRGIPSGGIVTPRAAETAPRAARDSLFAAAATCAAT